MKKKANVRKMIGLLFVVIGISCMLYPVYYYVQQGREIEELHQKLNLIRESEVAQVSNSVTQKNSATMQENSDVTQETQVEEVEESLGQVMMLSIPAIDLYQPILETLSDDNLNIALTQIKEDQVLGSGNFTVAGHLSSVDGRHFNRLPEVQIGDEVSVIANQQVYIFKVDSRQVIKATDVDVLDNRSESEITLITCTPGGKKRLAVKGYLVSVENILNE